MSKFLKVEILDEMVYRYITDATAKFHLIEKDPFILQ